MRRTNLVQTLYDLEKKKSEGIIERLTFGQAYSLTLVATSIVSFSWFFTTCSYLVLNPISRAESRIDPIFFTKLEGFTALCILPIALLYMVSNTLPHLKH